MSTDGIKFTGVVFLTRILQDLCYLESFALLEFVVIIYLGFTQLWQ